MYAKIIYQKRWMIFWWFIAMAGTAFITLIFFPAFKNSNIGNVFASLPKQVQHLVGNSQSYSTINGYITQQIFGLRAPLIIIILSIITYNSLTISEERKGLLETHVSLPLTRSKILTSKILAGMTIIVLSSLGLFLGAEIALLFIHESYSAITLLKLVGNSTLLGLIFGLIIVFLNSIFGIRGIVLGLCCAYAFLSYLISSLVVTSHNLSGIEHASLFHFYSQTGSIYLKDIMTLGIIGLVLIVLSFIFFTRRDIET